jgi:hypothetical protein
MKPFLSDCQHGFLNGRSTITQLLDCVGQWTKLLDEGSAVDVIFLDYAKAFDSVPHQRLLQKLEGYGVRGDVLGWIRDFLKDRRQRVVINGEESGWRAVLSGIPQGSVLGPVLFICFVNDMPDVVHGLIRMFADDTEIFSNVDTAEACQRLQSDLDALQQWSDEWQLRFNATKCKSMHLGRNNSKHPYYMKDATTTIELEETVCEKDLGVHMDPSLKFAEHCHKVVSKANQILGLIRRSFDFIDKQSLTYLYKGLVRPHLEYGNVVWSPLHKKDATLLENVQRRATKLAPEVAELEYEERLRALKLPSLMYRRLRGDLIEAYKLTHGFYNVDVESYLPRSTEERTRGHKYKIKKQPSRLDIRKHYFSLRVVETWNSLPELVVEAPTLNSFKNRLDRCLADHQFSVEFPLKVIPLRKSLVEEEEEEPKPEEDADPQQA